MQIFTGLEINLVTKINRISVYGDENYITFYSLLIVWILIVVKSNVF